jgi:hypothetical protein
MAVRAPVLSFQKGRSDRRQAGDLFLFSINLVLSGGSVSFASGITLCGGRVGLGREDFGILAASVVLISEGWQAGKPSSWSAFGVKVNDPFFKHSVIVHSVLTQGTRGFCLPL